MTIHLTPSFLKYFTSPVSFHSLDCPIYYLNRWLPLITVSLLTVVFYLSILFTSIISHGYVPDDFMKTVLLPIIKSITGDMHDVNNYCPIALLFPVQSLFS